MRELQAENARLKKLLAESLLDAAALKVALGPSTDPTGKARGGDGDEREDRDFGAPSMPAYGVVAHGAVNVGLNLTHFSSKSPG